ncbi:hypothetical protein QAD02_021439 [Eretmocerus hayati]|uniref:Uncharacterized protein n=1 Tax=Eretmocerus hayati TaxID=131215 RepID=A0ACC2PS49_9HYME|nr:hypothetical protein QAD02_021439 [Eretmocerus hayati]
MIDEFQSFARSRVYGIKIPSDAPREHFYADYAQAPSTFEFSLADRNTLLEIMDVCKSKPDSFWTERISHRGLKRSYGVMNGLAEGMMDIINDLLNRCEFNTSGNANSRPTWTRMLIESLISNCEVAKAGHRYSEGLQKFGTYAYLTGGRHLYEYIASNLPLPSVAAVIRYTRQTYTRIEVEIDVEGMKAYFELWGLSKIICLSEDAMKITPKYQYDSRNHELAGPVLPTGKNGMPIPHSFSIKNEEDMVNHVKNGELANNLYCYMAQPLTPNAPPYCVTLYGTNLKFTAEDCIKRWLYIAKVLEENGFEVVGYASDGDPRLLSAMKIKSKLGTTMNGEQYKFPWFHADYKPDKKYFQDTVHVVNKLKTRLLKLAIAMIIGNFIVSLVHLEEMIDCLNRDKHCLAMSDLDGKDKMNFDATLRMCHPKVIDRVKESPGSDATV